MQLADVKTTSAYRYTGRRLDDETGLYYYRAHMYDPDLGRFLQPDPISYVDGLNLYRYARNDPPNLVDPSGTCAGLCVGTAIIVGGFVFGAGGSALADYVKGQAFNLSRTVTFGVVGAATAGHGVFVTTAIRLSTASIVLTRLQQFMLAAFLDAPFNVAAVTLGSGVAGLDVNAAALDALILGGLGRGIGTDVFPKFPPVISRVLVALDALYGRLWQQVQGHAPVPVVSSISSRLRWASAR